MKIKMKDLLFEAQMLIDDGENQEYSRGICELLATFQGLTLSDGGALEVGRQIGLTDEDMENWYVRVYHD